MCGIAGVLNSNLKRSQNKWLNIVEDMTLLQQHRGPDDTRTQACDYAVLGHSRLSIIDLESGNQPFSSSDGRYTLIFNGEIYNYIELKIELEQLGYYFRTHSDTEVLLNYLIQFGVKGLSKLNGMFAFCFFNCVTGEWILARDHVGIKPLYFYHTSGELAFASEIKALTALPDFKRELDHTSFSEYMAFQFCLSSNTLFKGVSRLEPGSYMTGKYQNITSKGRYWEPDYQVDTYHSTEYFVEKLEYLLNDSIRLQVRSDVDLGSYLSGGLDSSSVSYFASRMLGNGLPIFTGRFDLGSAYDESDYAQLMSNHISGSFHLATPSSQDFVDNISNIIYHMDEPVAGPGVFPQFMVSSLASDKVKVVLGGQGGDELFAGYTRYFVAYLEQALKQQIYSQPSTENIGLVELLPNMPLLKQYVPMLKSFFNNGLFEQEDKRYFHLINRMPNASDILSVDAFNQLDPDAVFEKFSTVFNDCNSDSYLNKMLNFDFKTFLPSLLHIEDRVSMASSIESRVPLLDYRIVELLATVPADIKFSAGQPKYMLKKLMSPKLPNKIVNRQDKMGFPVPLADWSKSGPVKDFIHDTLKSRASVQRGIFSKKALESATENCGVGARQLWGMLCLELWHQKFIDG